MEQSTLLKQQSQTHSLVRPAREGEAKQFVPLFLYLIRCTLHVYLSVGKVSLSVRPGDCLVGYLFIVFIVYAMDLARLQQSRRSLNIIIATGPLFYLYVCALPGQPQCFSHSNHQIIMYYLQLADCGICAAAAKDRNTDYITYATEEDFL